MSKAWQWCAVIPAAGRGSRLGADRPKILVEVAPHTTIWDILRAKLTRLVDHIHVVVSPSARAQFEQARAGAAHVSVGVQEVPRGMGDAIFGSINAWGNAKNILILWGDQVHISHDTLTRAIAAHEGMSGPHCTLPLAKMPVPYVEYIFENGALSAILQSREGDTCNPGGLGDVGLFLLSTQGLKEAWDEYLTTQSAGAKTGEINFLPFLIFLAQKRNWAFTRIEVNDANEARGINTQDDLAFFHALYKGGK